MKKKVIIGIGLIILFILLAIAGTVLFILNNKKNENKETIYNIAEKEYEYFILYVNEKYGVIDNQGNIVVNPDYDSIVIPNPKEELFICSTKDSNKNKVLNAESKSIFTIYDNIEPISINGITTSLPYENNILKYEVNGKYGLVNINEKRITKAIYEDIDGLKYKEGELIAKKDGKYGVISTSGDKIVNFDYYSIEADKYYLEGTGYKNSGYIVCNKTEEGYRYGYISNNGKKILEPEYNDIKRITDIDDENNIYLIVSKNGQYGLLKNGEKIIDYKYQGIEYNSLNNLLIINKSTKYGVYTLDGKEIIPIEYKTLLFNGVYVYAKNGDEVKYFTNKGEEVTTGFTALQPVKEGKYYISTNEYGLFGIVDSNVNTLVENKYVLIDYLFNNYFLAYRNSGEREILDVNGSVASEYNKFTILNRILNANLIKAEDMQNSNIKIYDEKLEIVAELDNAKLDIRDKYLKLYNDNEEIYVDMEGNIIKESEAIASSEEAPDNIGEYRKEYFGYSQIYYTRD